MTRRRLITYVLILAGFLGLYGCKKSQEPNPGEMSDAEYYSSKTINNRLVTGDLNGDGVDDIVRVLSDAVYVDLSTKDKGYQGKQVVCGGPELFFLKYGKDGNLPALKEICMGGKSFPSVAISDITKDGHPDLLLGCAYETVVLENNGKGEFSPF